jgi:hypothetical protein
MIDDTFIVSIAPIVIIIRLLSYRDEHMTLNPKLDLNIVYI